MTSSPLWTSAFRPFYLLGALYAPLLVAAWLGAFLGLWNLPSGQPLKLLHGHEFLFGFAAAIITGIVLTALPGWAGTAEIRGAPLMLLVALWLAGRLAVWAAPWLPSLLPGAVDCLLFAALFAMLAPQLLRAANRLYLLLLPILLALLAANLLYHHGLLREDQAQSERALRLAVYGIVMLYTLKGGVLAPVFTGNALREKGLAAPAPCNMALEIAAAGALLLLAALDLAAAPPAWSGSAALACALLHGWRTARWQGWRVAEVPLLLLMHLGFAWLVLAFALKAAADLTGIVPAAAWLHAFTVGSLGLMMLGLMTRVSLRHTGRALVPPRAVLVAGVMMFAAALLRLAATVHGLGHAVVALAAVLWATAFALFLLAFGKVLLAPSVPRAAGPPNPRREIADDRH